MKSVIITGSNRGIGFETALTFAKAGYKVYATMRNIQSAQKLSATAESENLEIILRQMDVDSDESVKHCISNILEENGPVDVLVNNAGIERRGALEETDISVYQQVMNTNYFGPIRCSKAVIPSMRERNSGCIIHITSVAGRIAVAPFGPYNGSKFALEGISESMAIELRPFNIRVAVVEPGIIDTDMAQGIRNSGASKYPNGARMAALFSTSLQKPVHPSLVAEKILEVAESKDSQLRHPVGPDAEPFLAWRDSMTDAEWVSWHSADDETWYDALENDVGMNARPARPIVDA